MGMEESYMDTLTAKHARALEFKDTLAGPQGCDFRLNDEGKTIWTCNGKQSQDRHAYSTKILTAMGFDVDASLKHFDKCGGYCDCEVLWNVLWMVKHPEGNADLAEDVVKEAWNNNVAEG